MDFAEVEVDYKYHSHIIGKNGANGEILKYFEKHIESPFGKLTARLILNFVCRNSKPYQGGDKNGHHNSQ